MSRLRSIAALSTTALLLIGPAAAPAYDSLQPDTTVLLGTPAGLGTLPDDSVNFSGANGAALSKNGRYVAFTSSADGISGEDVDTIENVYVRDLQTNTTTLVSRATGLNGAAFDKDSFAAAISGDGTKVAFDSTATNGGASGAQVYVRDLVNHTTVIASCATTTSCTAGNGASGEPNLNDGGTKLAFSSTATNLVAGDTNGDTKDIFVRDLTAHTTVLVSRKTGAGGVQIAAPSDSPTISDNGNRVAWDISGALDPTDANNASDVYMRDITGNLTRWVSHSAQNSGSYSPSISGNGAFVGFTTALPFDAVHDTNSQNDVYLWNVAADSFALISRATGANTNAGNFGSVEPAVDTTGTTVAFTSFATNLGDGDTTPTSDVHVRSGSTTSLISRAAGAAGAIGAERSQSPSIDDTGASVAFNSVADNLVATIGATDQDRVYVRTPGSTSTVVASVPTGPATISWPKLTGHDGLGTSYFQYGQSAGSALSDDGRYLAFASESDALLGTDNDAVTNVYVRDLVTGKLTLVSQSTDGQPGDGHSFGATISADGTHVAFLSGATNLGGPGGFYQAVFVRDLVHGTTTLASRADGAAGAVDPYATGTTLNADGTRVAFMASADLDAKDTNGTYDVYVRDVAHDTTTLVSRIDGAGTNAGNNSSVAAAIDGAGNRVAFITYAGDLGDGDTGGLPNVHLRDLTANTTVLVDRADGPSGAPGNDLVYGVSIDRAGNRVAFDSSPTNFVSPPPGRVETYVRDLGAATTTLVSRADGAAGAPANRDTLESQISGDGRRVVFKTGADNLIPGGPPTTVGAFVRDIAAGTTRLASRADGANGAAATTIDDPSLDGAGDCVAFISNDQLTTPGFGSRDFSHVHLRVMSGECPHVAPDTKIDSAPSGTITTATAQFAFSADETGASFSCKLDGAGYSACTSPLTATALANGPHTLSVRATDRAGLIDASPATASFTVAVPGAGADTVRPVVSGLAVKPSAFAVATGPTALAAAKHKVPRGTRIVYTLSEPARATLTIARRLPGRRKGKKCVAPGKAKHGAKRCTRSEKAGTLVRDGAQGKRTVRFSGRVGTRRLARGRYLLTVRARDAAGNRSNPVKTTFKVVHG
jgi:hypothetical protein